jgi:ElaB/YqjD/DUF883 family membrane-anchored ribosome-binding protein
MFVMEEITLDKIDIIRQRTGLSYAEAKQLLEKNGGNMVDALIDYEGSQKSFRQNVTDTGNEVIDTVKNIIEKGNVTRVKVKKDNRTVVDMPVNAAVIAGGIGMFYPVLLGLGAVTAIASKVTIEIERPDGRVEVVNDFIKENAQNFKGKTEEFVKNAADKTENVAQNMADKAEDVINNIKDDIKNR